MNKLAESHNGLFGLKKEILTNATTWVNLEDTVLKEASPIGTNTADFIYRRFLEQSHQ